MDISLRQIQLKRSGRSKREVIMVYRKKTRTSYEFYCYRWESRISWWCPKADRKKQEMLIRESLNPAKVIIKKTV